MLDEEFHMISCQWCGDVKMARSVPDLASPAMLLVLPHILNT